MQNMTVRILLTLLHLVAFGPLLATAHSKAVPRLSASSLYGFCSGDTRYGSQPIAYCLHYANGVLDAVGESCLPKYSIGSSELLRNTLVAWLAAQQDNGVDLNSMSGAEAIQSAINDTYCAGAQKL